MHLVPLTSGRESIRDSIARSGARRPANKISTNRLASHAQQAKTIINLRTKTPKSKRGSSPRIAKLDSYSAHNGNLRRATDDLTHELSDPPTAVKYLEGFGITQAPAIRALDILRQHPGFEDTKDLAELAEIDEAQFLRYLRWSEILGYIKSDSRSGMVLDPIISRLLGAWTIL